MAMGKRGERQTPGGRLMVPCEKSVNPPVGSGSRAVTRGQSVRDQHRTSAGLPASSAATRPSTGSMWLSADTPAMRGSDWRKMDVHDINKFLVRGTNVVAIKATNSDAGAAGLVAGRALLMPGDLSRATSMRRQTPCTLQRAVI